MYDAVQRLEEFHTLAHDEALMAIMRQVVGETAFPHPLKIARLGFPAHYEVSTPPHQDYPNNQGTPNLTAAWIPVGDCPTRPGRPRRPARLAHVRRRCRSTRIRRRQPPGDAPDEMLEELRWVTTDYSAGDVLFFPSLTVHASLHNASEFYHAAVGRLPLPAGGRGAHRDVPRTRTSSG